MKHFQSLKSCLNIFLKIFVYFFENQTYKNRETWSTRFLSTGLLTHHGWIKPGSRQLPGAPSTSFMWLEWAEAPGPSSFSVP